MQKDTETKNQCGEETPRKGKKANGTKQNINKKVNNNNGGQANKTKTMNVWGRYVKQTCWRDKNCTTSTQSCAIRTYIEDTVGRHRVTSITHRSAA